MTRPEHRDGPGRDPADELRRALAERGIVAEVEPRGALAVVVPGGTASPSLDAATRRWLVQAARDAGFTHVAMEIVGGDAALSGAGPA